MDINKMYKENDIWEQKNAICRFEQILDAIPD